MMIVSKEKVNVALPSFLSKVKDAGKRFISATLLTALLLSATTISNEAYAFDLLSKNFLTQNQKETTINNLTDADITVINQSFQRNDLSTVVAMRDSKDSNKVRLYGKVQSEKEFDRAYVIASTIVGTKNVLNKEEQFKTLTVENMQQNKKQTTEVVSSVTRQHINTIRDKFKEANIADGDVYKNEYNGKVMLTGTYADRDELRKAFDIAVEVVGEKNVDFSNERNLTLRNIKTRENVAQGVGRAVSGVIGGIFSDKKTDVKEQVGESASKTARDAVSDSIRRSR